MVMMSSGFGCLKIWWLVICVVQMMHSHVIQSEDTHWCHDHEEEVDPFADVKHYMNISTPGISPSDLDEVIQTLFQRVGCQNENLAVTCQACLTSDHIYSVLDIPDSTTPLDRPLFYRASSIILPFLYHLPEMCNKSATADWSNLHHHQFVDALMAFEPHDHVENNAMTESNNPNHNGGILEYHNAAMHDGAVPSHHNVGATEEGEFFTIEQMDRMLHEINSSYTPGPLWSKQMGCAESFRARDIFIYAELLEPHDGATAAEMDVVSSHVIAKLLEGQCIFPDRLASDGLPDEGDFIKAIFDHYGNHSTCKIQHYGFETLASDLSAGGDDHDDDNHDDDHDDDEHDEQVEHIMATKYARHEKQHREISRMRTKRSESHDHDSLLPDVNTMCLTAEEILSTFYMESHDVSISRDDFLRLCPALLQQSVLGCKHEPESIHTAPPMSQTYGYGTAAVLLISACAALGLLLVRARRAHAYQYIMAVMLGLAFGTLVGDSFLHLIPHALGLHAHEDDAHAHEEGGIVVDEFVWKMLGACASIWAFFILHILLHGISGGHDKKREYNVQHIGSVGGNNNPAFYANSGLVLEVTVDSEKSNFKSEKPSVDCENTDDRTQSVDCEKTHDIMQEDTPVQQQSVESANSSMAWMAVTGDLIHNMADGLAIGAAFAADWQTGVSTSIAVFCHELPHEFGDVGLMMSCGWSLKKVALFQMVSASSAFVGLYIGIPLAGTQVAREWIFVITSGMFLYVALSNVIPELVELFKGSSFGKMFLASNGGILLGFTFMILIAIFEDMISIS